MKLAADCILTYIYIFGKNGLFWEKRAILGKMILGKKYFGKNVFGKNGLGKMTPSHGMALVGPESNSECPVGCLTEPSSATSVDPDSCLSVTGGMAPVSPECSLSK